MKGEKSEEHVSGVYRILFIGAGVTENYQLRSGFTFFFEPRQELEISAYRQEEIRNAP